MSVGLLLITHDDIGKTLLEVAIETLHGNCPIDVRYLAVSAMSDPEATHAHGERLVAELDRGDGVLILTDAYGSTPSNIACQLSLSHRTAVVTGLNLPMLLRVLNYPALDLPELADKALTGGRDGVLRPYLE